MLRTLLGIALAALILAAPATALAQYREFTGKIDKINKKQLIVDNRMGDKLKFQRVDSTTVEGQGKASWEDLKKGDWTTVYWKMMDKPRKAYEIEVLPPRVEEGEDE